MRRYRLVRLDRAGHTLAETEVEVVDDPAAQERAYRFMNDGAVVEVWDAARWVARVTNRRRNR